MKTLSIFVMVDGDGNYTVGTEQKEAVEAFEENIGIDGPTRMIELRLEVELPAATVLTGVVPAGSEQAQLSVRPPVKY